MIGFFESARRWMDRVLVPVHLPWHFKVLTEGYGRWAQADGGIAFQSVSEGGMTFENVSDGSMTFENVEAC